MGVLGKILIFLNILVAAGFIYLALQVNERRQTWSLALLEHELVLAGLPTDAPALPSEPTPEIGEGFVLFDYQIQKGAQNFIELPRNTLIRIFKNFQGGMDLGVIDNPEAPVPEKDENRKFVTSQQKEVERVREKVLKNIDKLADARPASAADRRERLRVYLLGLARSGQERDGINALLKDLFDLKRVVTARRELSLLGKSEEVVRAFQDVYEAATKDKALPEDTERTRQTSIDAVKALARTDADKTAIEAISKLIAAPESDQKEALAEEAGKNLLLSWFDLALKPAAKVESEKDSKTELNEKKLLIAHLLYHLDPIDPVSAKFDPAAGDPRNPQFMSAAVPGAVDFETNATGQMARYWTPRMDWHKRVRLIIGADAYRTTAESQASELGIMASRLGTIIKLEDAAFRPEYQALVQQALFLARQMTTVEAQLLAQKDLADKLTVALKARTDERDMLLAELAAQRKIVTDALAALTVDEKSLFKLQQAVIAAQDELKKLEGQVIDLEKQLKTKAKAPLTSR